MNGDLTEMQHAVAEIARFCREQALGPEVASDLELAVEELFTNALRHGGCQGLREAVRVRIEIAAGALQVEFCDRGGAFDPNSIPAPNVTAPLSARADGGLGIHLVRQTMGRLHYRYSGGWNCISMRRPIDPQERLKTS